MNWSLLRKIYNRLRYARYYGGPLYCNSCGARYSRFADWLRPNKARALELWDVVAGYGPNNICPWCLSSARERLVLAVLQTLLKVQGQVVLHLAPEGCIYDFLSEGNQVIAGDRDPLSYRQIASDLACLDAVRLPFTEGTFGLVVANHVLEHIPDDREVMKELFRVLKRGGAAILQVPIGLRLGAILESLEALSDDERIDRFGQKDHVRIYSLQGIRERLELAGFRVRVYQQSELGIMENLSLQANEVLISAVKP